jgi:hypothetical protein
MRLDVMLAHGKPQTPAGSCSRRIRFVEPFKEAHGLVTLNARAGVRNPEFDPAVNHASTSLDPSTGGLNFRVLTSRLVRICPTG